MDFFEFEDAQLTTVSGLAGVQERATGRAMAVATAEHWGREKDRPEKKYIQNDYTVSFRNLLSRIPAKHAEFHLTW